MAAEAFMLNSAQNQQSFRMPSSQAMSPISQPNPFDTEMPVANVPIGSERIHGRSDAEAVAAILMRKLPRNTTNEALRTMFLFAKDFVGADFVPTEFPDDKGYLSAIARFRNSTAAYEARALLDGKQNSANEAPMIVDVLRLSPGGGLGLRRTNFDAAASTSATNSASSTGSTSSQATRYPSRFNGTFHAMDRISPPSDALAISNSGPMSPAEYPAPDVASPFQNFFSPQSPIGQLPGDRQRVSGKSVIGEDSVDDEPGELLKDPVAYAKSDMSSSIGQLSRRSTSSQLPTSRFTGLPLNTSNVSSPPMQSFPSPRTAAPLQSPASAMSPTAVGNLGPNASYLANQHYQRHNYPPVNPADQNPPCNTLYVGNLPIDTSEDELKAMFSKQRGYKRLCFRTKQNGPMCFVEFEDISFATKALNELYGHPLHNSIKGGIRLSFSKNPLGVRTGQPGGMGPPTPMSPQGPMAGINGIGSMPSFSTANGPPPGLTAPPGLTNVGATGSLSGISSPVQGGMMSGGFSVGGLGMSGFGMSAVKGPAGSMATGSPWAGPSDQFSDYMLGR